MSRVSQIVTGVACLATALLFSACGAGWAQENAKSPSQLKIEAALASPASMEFIETPLADVLDFLKQFHDIDIQVDREALRRAKLSTETPVTLNLRGVSLRSALGLLLRDLDLACVVRSDHLLITTPEEAKRWKPVETSKKPERGSAAAKLTDGERKVVEALQSRTTMEFIETPLQDVVDYLKDLHRIEIQMDKRILKDTGVGTEWPVTIRVKRISLYSALRLILGNLELTFAVDDGFLLITSPEEGKRWATGDIPLKVDGINLKMPRTAAMAANERKIADALKSPIQMEFVETPLEDVIAFVTDLKDINILIDYPAQEALGMFAVDQKAAVKKRLVTRSFKDVSLASALELIVRDLDLGYTIRDEVLVISPAKKPSSTSPSARAPKARGSKPKRDTLRRP